MSQKKEEEKEVEVDLDPNWAPTIKQTALFSAGAAAILQLGYVSPDPNFTAMCGTFCLSGIIGYNVVWGVSHSLHSPLMSITNAISGMTAVGGALCMGGGYLPHTPAQALAASAVMLSVSISIVIHALNLALFCLY